MKRFISILLCIVLPFMSLAPLTSNAIDIQGAEYPTPSFLPIDVDFSQYDYYFVSVSGKPDTPSYRIYLFKDNADSGHLYVSAKFTASDTKFHRSSYTSFSVTTDYNISYSTYSSSSGSWSSIGIPSDTRLTDFVFDGYSEMTSSSKYIIGCNTDIYDYSGNLVRKGDYNNLVSYFRGGLNGGEDKSDSSGSESGGSVNLDSVLSKLDTIIKKLDSILNAVVNGSGGGSSIDIDFLPNSLESILQAIQLVADSLSTEIIEDTLEEIKTRVANVSSTVAENFDEFTNTFNQKIQLVRDDISTFEAHLVDFKLAFLEFSSVGGEIKNLAGLFSEVHVSISNLRSALETDIETITTSFNDFADNIKTNVSSIKTTVESFTGKFDTIISKLGLIIDALNSISGKISDCYSELYNISYYSKWINTNICDYLGSISSTLNDFRKISSTYFYGMIDLVGDIMNEVISLPENLKNLLKELFIPKEDHFSELNNKINSHFGFVSQVLKLGDALLYDEKGEPLKDVFDKSQPSYSIEFDSDTYGHFKTDIIDFSVVAPHIELIRSINTGIILYFFIRRTRRKLPDIINGIGGD